MQDIGHVLQRGKNRGKERERERQTEREREDYKIMKSFTPRHHTQMHGHMHLHTHTHTHTHRHTRCYVTWPCQSIVLMRMMLSGRRSSEMRIWFSWSYTDFLGTCDRTCFMDLVSAIHTSKEMSKCCGSILMYSMQ